jgi:flagellin-like protein
MTQQRRAVSSVIAVVLMVAVVVILSATVSAAVLNVTDALNEPAPTVAQTSGEFVPGADDQEVRVTHVAGDSVRVENIEIIVRVSGPDVDTTERLIDLPADGSDIDEENLRNDNGVVSKGYGAAGPADPNQVIIEDYPTDDNVWDVGETIQFEINVGEADFRSQPDRTGPDADELEITIVHTESDAILFEEVFRL